MKPPVEIVRIYRSLERYFSDWKASELRYFLLFYSPVDLKKYLPLKYYKHWLLLVNFMRRLAKQTISNRDLQVCRILAVRFTRSIPKLYGKKYVRYNVHLLTHIVDSVQTWGAPWASSAFLYESWGGLLSNFYKGTKSVTKEIFSYFLARKSFRKFSKCHMENASKSVKKF